MSDVYKLQNRAIHEARRQLERKGIISPWASLDQIREMAAELNHGILSISKLSLDQRRSLIEKLIEMGANVKNPILYDSDLRAETAGRGVKRKVLEFTQLTEKQLRWVDGLAAQVQWSHANDYARLQNKLFGGQPKTSKQLQRLAHVVRGILNKQGQGKSQDGGKRPKLDP